MYLVPQTFDVKRQFTCDGVLYRPGDTIDGTELVKVRSADVLLSRRFVVPTPDPHARRTDPLKPTPTALPATVRQKITNSTVYSITAEQDPVEPLTWRFDLVPSTSHSIDNGDGSGFIYQDDGHSLHRYAAAGDYTIVAKVDGRVVAQEAITVVDAVSELQEDAVEQPVRRTRTAKRG